MEVRLAECAGFCFGVKRAIDTVYAQIETGKKIYTYGPIVHNEEVVKELENKGVHVLEGLEDLNSNLDGTVIIRAHGVPRDTQKKMEEKGLECIDATCPFVKRIHRIVQQAGAEGRHVVIAGNPGHPEVEGIKGWCSGPVTVLETEKEALLFEPEENRRVCLVAQTTFNYNKFQELVEIISEKGYDIIVLNTICNATEERQTEAARIAAEVDAMIVIGGRSSSNTQKLFEICKKECNNTYYIQTVKDLDLTCLKSIDNVGITAGASTPNKIIEEVQKNVRSKL